MSDELAEQYMLFIDALNRCYAAGASRDDVTLLADLYGVDHRYLDFDERIAA